MNIDYDAELQDKLDKNQHLWEMLRPQAEAGAQFNLDLFFYADSKEAAGCVVSALSELGYETSVKKQGSVLRRMWLTRGTTPPTELTRSGIDKWTRQMVDIARNCSSHFDGWGAQLPT